MIPSDYRQDLRRYLQARGNLFASLTRHPTLLGGSREHALAELLRPIVPRRFEVLTGTIAAPSEVLTGTSAAPSEYERSPCQVDLMVVNTLDYPTVVKDGGIAVVFPESVEIIIEVKTKLSAPKDLFETFVQIRRVHRSSAPPPLSVLFSYGYPATSETLQNHIEKALEQAPPPWFPAAQEAAPPDANTWDKTDLPNLIVTDSGVIAEKLEGREYTFVDEDPFNYLLHKVITQLLPPRSQSSQPKRISAGVRSLDALLGPKSP